jgi:phytoene synthase
MEEAYALVLRKMLAQGWQAPRRRISTSKPRLRSAIW